jgi:hypothetical protein
LGQPESDVALFYLTEMISAEAVKFLPERTHAETARHNAMTGGAMILQELDSVTTAINTLTRQVRRAHVGCAQQSLEGTFAPPETRATGVSTVEHHAPVLQALRVDQAHLRILARLALGLKAYTVAQTEAEVAADSRSTNENGLEGGSAVDGQESIPHVEKAQPPSDLVIDR